MSEVQEKPKKFVSAPKDISYFNKNEELGRWKLEVLIERKEDLEKFSLLSLDPYIHPVAGKKYLPNIEGQPAPFFIIDKILTRFNPEDNPLETKILDWLISHPKVDVPGMKLDERVKNNKSKPLVRLVNLDAQDISEMEESNVVDQMLGRLSFDTGVYAIGLEKLRYISADIGKPYKDRRYAKNANTEKNYLRKAVKDYVRRGKEEAQHVIDLVNNIENARRSFILKVLLEYGLVVKEYSIYKFEGKVIGSTFDSCVEFLAKTPDVEEDMFMKAKNFLKEDGFTI